MPFDRTKYVTTNPLEDVAFDFMVDQKDYVADILFSPKVVDKTDKKIYQMDTSKLRVVDDRKGTNSEPNLVDEQMFSTTVSLEEHKLAREINPKNVRDADIPALLDESRAVKQVTNQLLINRELLAATLATTTGNYPAALTSAIASGSRWNEGAGDPESDMVTVNAALRNTCGRSANAIMMSVDTFDKLKLSPNFRDRVKYTNGGPVSAEAIKAFFGVDNVFIARARYDSANEGLAKVVAGFWGTNVIAFVYNPSSALEDVGYGHMYTTNQMFWTDVQLDTKRRGPAGYMKRITVGSEYKLAPGYVAGDGDSDFNAGYLLRTVVA